jgi:hypothetical protein
MEVSQSDSPLATFNYYKLPAAIRGRLSRHSRDNGKRRIGDLDKWSAERTLLLGRNLSRTWLCRLGRYERGRQLRRPFHYYLGEPKRRLMLLTCDD